MSALCVVQGDTHVGVRIRRTSFEGATKTSRFLNTTLIQNIDSGVPGRGVPDLPLNEPAVAIGCGHCKLAGTCRALFLQNQRSVHGPSLLHEKHHDRFVKPTWRQNAIRRTMCGFNNACVYRKPHMSKHERTLCRARRHTCGSPNQENKL